MIPWLTFYILVYAIFHVLSFSIALLCLAFLKFFTEYQLFIFVKKINSLSVDDQF